MIRLENLINKFTKKFPEEKFPVHLHKLKVDRPIMELVQEEYRKVLADPERESKIDAKKEHITEEERIELINQGICACANIIADLEILQSLKPEDLDRE